MRAPTWDPSGDQTQCPALFIYTLRGVAQLVARTAGGREVAGSSPVTPTIDRISRMWYFLFMTKNTQNFYPDHPPENVYFDTNAISWNDVHEGNDARRGVIQAGFNETFPIPDSGERIWLNEPTGKQSLTVNVLDAAAEVIPDESRTLTGAEGEEPLFIQAGRSINVVTPADQGDIGYGCDYPGVEPGAHQ